MTENQSSGQPDKNELTLWNIIRLLLDKIYLLVLSGIAFAAAVYLFLAFAVTPLYESSVSFYVYNSSDKEISSTINNSDLQAAESLANTYSQILASNSVLDAVLSDLGNTSGLTRKELSEMVSVSVISDTQLLEVVVTSADPVFACEIANSFASAASTEMVRITKAGGMEVVDKPEIATEKSSPRTVFDTAAGFLVGAILAAVFVILRLISDTTIYLPADVEKHTDVTVLGEIPSIDGNPANYKPWLILKGGVIRFEEK